MALSFHPRHPSEVREDNQRRFRNRPSILANNTRIQIVVVIPAIITALAVYMALFFVNKVLRGYQDEAGWGGGTSEAGEQEVLIREIDGVVEEPVTVETLPPPSPDLFRAEIERQRQEATPAPVPGQTIILEPVLEPEPLAEAIKTIDLTPVDVPNVGVPESLGNVVEEAAQSDGG